MLEILKDDHKLLRRKAKRVDKIDDTVRNLAGHPMLETHEGLTARCIFHEIEHLNGVIFTERKDT